MQNAQKKFENLCKIPLDNSWKRRSSTIMAPPNPLSRIKALKFVHFSQKNADFFAFFVHFDEKISILYKNGGVSALIFYDFGFLVRVKSIL